MAEYTRGTVLKCGHEDCGCRVRIESACGCPGAGGAYVCTCGAPMVEVPEHDADSAGAAS